MGEMILMELLKGGGLATLGFTFYTSAHRFH